MSLSDQARPSRLRTTYPAIVLFFMTAGFVVIKTARDALYIQDDGLFALPRAYILIAIFSVPQAYFVLKALKTLGPRLTRLMLPSVVAASVIAYAPFAMPGSSLRTDIFFVAVPLVFSVVFSSAWLLTGELLGSFDRDIVARGYGRVAAASMTGGAAGGVIASRLSSLLGPQKLLVLGAAFLGAAVFVIVLAHRAFSPPDADNDGSTTAEFPPAREVVRQPYVFLLLSIAVMGGVTAIMIDFSFYAAAATSGRNAAENASFFALVYTFVNAGALVFQLLVAPRLQNAIGFTRTLMILPLALFGGGASLFFFGTPFARAALRVGEGGLRSSVFRANWEQAFIGLPARSRQVAKVLVDGLGTRLAEGAAAGMLAAWLGWVVVDASALPTHSTLWITVIIVVASGAWLMLTRKLEVNLPPALADPERPYLPPPPPDG